MPAHIAQDAAESVCVVEPRYGCVHEHLTDGSSHGRRGVFGPHDGQFCDPFGLAAAPAKSSTRPAAGAA